MHIIYDNVGNVISISGIREGTINKNLVDTIQLVDPLPNGQYEYRIYDVDLIMKVWEALDAGKTLQVVLDNGEPIGIMADGERL